MRAIFITSYAGPAAIEIAEVNRPDATIESPVVIDVHAAGVTFPDLLQTRGLYQAQPALPFIPGAEVAGTVRSAPADSGFTEGQRVCAFSKFGGYAETVATSAGRVFALPDSLSFVQGAAVPMNLLTAHFGLIRRGALQKGETVLVHGAGGGVGLAATQMAVAIGAEVIAVASSEEKKRLAASAGARHTISPERFKEATKEITAGRGVDMVVDPVGGDRFTDSLRSLAPEGRLLVIGFTEGQIPTAKVNRLMLNNISIIGVGTGAFWVANPEYLAEQWSEVEPLLAAGRLDPLIGAQFPLEKAHRALEAMANRTATGKLVLTVR